MRLTRTNDLINIMPSTRFCTHKEIRVLRSTKNRLAIAADRSRPTNWIASFEITYALLGNFVASVFNKITKEHARTSETNLRATIGETILSLAGYGTRVVVTRKTAHWRAPVLKNAHSPTSLRKFAKGFWHLSHSGTTHCIHCAIAAIAKHASAVRVPTS
jgi:hypothetical protein